MDTKSFINILGVFRKEMIARGCHNILLEIGTPGNYVNFFDWDINKPIPGLRFQSYINRHGIDVEFRQDDNGNFYVKHQIDFAHLNAKNIGYEQLLLSFRLHVVEVSEQLKRDIPSC